MKQVDYREVLRLKHLNYSQNKISAIVRSSHHTIKSILDAAHERQISWPIDPDVTNQELELLLFPDKYKAVSLYVEPDYVYIHKELAKRGVTMTLLWDECTRRVISATLAPGEIDQFQPGDFNHYSKSTAQKS